MNLEFNVDGRPTVWQLYEPEYTQIEKQPFGEDKNLYLWMRKCTLHINLHSVFQFFNNVGLKITSVRQHEDFRELTIITDDRGHIWYACKASINA